MPIQVSSPPPAVGLSVDLDIEERTGNTQEVVDFLESIRWGTQGVLYTLKHVGRLLEPLPSPRWFLLRKQRHLIATSLIQLKPGMRGARPLTTLYTSMVAVREDAQGQGYGKRIGRYSLAEQSDQLGPQSLSYAYIEKGNTRSEALFSQLGFQVIAEFHATLFSRLFPRNTYRVIPLPLERVGTMRQLLKNLYADHALEDVDLSLHPADYWVLIERGEILAGVQVHPQRWEVQSIPGAGGTFALRWLPKIPVMKNLFNPRDFRFLKFGNLYIQNGHAPAALELLEAMLARFQLHAGMMYWDKRSPVYQQLAAARSFGLLNSLAETPVNVYGSFLGLSPHDIDHFCRTPFVISPLDI